MLEAIGASPGSHTDIDWHRAWVESEERVEVRKELARIKAERPAELEREHIGGNGSSAASGSKEGSLDADKQGKVAYNEFAAPTSVQFLVVLRRVFQQYWRTPSYVVSKLILATATVSLIK